VGRIRKMQEGRRQEGGRKERRIPRAV